MGFSLLINAVEYTCNVFRDSVMIRESLQANGATMDGIIQLSGSLTVPVGGQHVQFYRDGNLEFAGRIQSVEHMRPNNVNQYRISCADYTVDLDAELIQTELESQSAGDQVRRVIGLVGRGFGTANVNSGPTVGLQDIQYEAPSAIITRIAESIEHQWYVDYNRDINFFYVLDRPAPVTEIDFDTNVTDYADFTFSLDASQVKNVIYLSGATVKSGVSDSKAWLGDGDTRFYPLNYAPWSLADTVLRVNNLPVALKLDGVDSQAGDGASGSGAYLCLDNWGIRFPDASPPAQDAAIDVAYKYEYEPLVVVENAESIAYMKAIENQPGAPSSGRHAFKFNLPELRIDNEETIVDYGNLLLTRYAFPVYTGNFSSLTQGWQVGQNFVGTSAARGIGATTFYVTSLGKTLYQSSGGVAKFKYEIEVTSSPFPG